MMKQLIGMGVIFGLLYGCENKSLSESEEFRPREIHEDIEFHFDRIDIDGVEYLILEKDNNNPHEGFGFMAVRGNVLIQNQDSLLAYARAASELQIKIYAKLFNIPEQDARNFRDDLLTSYMDQKFEELNRMKDNKFSGKAKSVQDTIPEN